MAARHNRDSLGAKGSLSCREQLLAQRVKQVCVSQTCLKQIGRSKDFWVCAIDYIALEQPSFESL